MILIVRALSYFGSRHLTFYIMNGVSNQNGWAMHDHSNVTDSNLHQQVLVTFQMQRMLFTMMNKCFDLNNHNYNCSEYVSHQILSSMIKIEDIDSHILRLFLKGHFVLFTEFCCCPPPSSSPSSLPLFSFPFSSHHHHHPQARHPKSTYF